MNHTFLCHTGPSILITLYQLVSVYVCVCLSISFIFCLAWSLLFAFTAFLLSIPFKWEFFHSNYYLLTKMGTVELDFQHQLYLNFIQYEYGCVPFCSQILVGNMCFFAKTKPKLQKHGLVRIICDAMCVAVGKSTVMIAYFPKSFVLES